MSISVRRWQIDSQTNTALREQVKGNAAVRHIRGVTLLGHELPRVNLEGATKPVFRGGHDMVAEEPWGFETLQEVLVAPETPVPRPNEWWGLRSQALAPRLWTLRPDAAKLSSPELPAWASPLLHLNSRRIQG